MCQSENSKEHGNLLKELMVKITGNFKGAQRRRFLVDTT